MAIKVAIKGPAKGQQRATNKNVEKHRNTKKNVEETKELNTPYSPPKDRGTNNKGIRKRRKREKQPDISPKEYLDKYPPTGKLVSQVNTN